MKIGFAQHDPRFAFWMLLGYAASERAIELGITLAVEPASSAAEQSAVIDRFVDQRVDALLVGTIDSHELAPAVQRAIAAGIPVVTADTEIWGCEVASTICSDNLRGAELAAAFIVDHIGASGGWRICRANKRSTAARCARRDSTISSPSIPMSRLPSKLPAIGRTKLASG